MKNYAYLFLAAMTIFAACEKEVIPEPVPAPKNLTVFSDNFKIPDMLFKVDPVTGDTYLEAWKSEVLPEQKVGSNTYVPYLQRLGKDGKLKWGQWVPFTRKAGLSWVNQTVFDTTTDGCVIDGFSVVGQDGNSQAFITKINPDGTYAWGNEGKLFYDFGDKGVYGAPCESFVAADNEGGAWIAAGNGAETLVFARVDSDGNFVVEPIVFSRQKSTPEDEPLLRRPQMYVGSDNSLIALLQYSRDTGGGSTDVILEGHYDVVKIPADGNPGGIIQNQLNEDGLFHPGMRALLTEDGKGGAYAIFKNGVSDVHAYLYHFDSNANVDVKDVDLYPSGSAFLVLALYAAVDPKTSDLVVLIQDVLVDYSGYPYSVVNLQVADTKGNLRYENDGKNILQTKPKDTLLNNMGYFVPADDGKWTFTFFWNMAEKSCFFYKSKVDINGGKIQDVAEVTEIDEVLTNGPDDDSRILVTDGFLRHMWYRAEGMYIYGYDINVD